MQNIEAIWDVLKFAATAGVAAAITNQGILALRESRQRKRAATDLALKCAALLEQFTQDCLDRANYIETHLGMNGDPSDAETSIPSLPPYPTDPDGWLGMDKAESGRLINLRMVISESRRTCAREASFEAPLDIAEKFETGNILVASDAWHVATHLREIFKLPIYGKIDAREPEDDISLFLERRVNEIVATERIRDEQRAMNIARMEASLVKASDNLRQ